MPSLFNTAQQIAFDFSSPPDTEGLGFDLTIQRSAKRRTIEIIIRRGGVDLMLPSFVSNEEGMEFVHAKRDWIVKTLAKQAQLENEVVVKQYIEGETFDYLGKSFPLKIFITQQPSARLVDDSLYIGIRDSKRMPKSDAVKKQVWAWYQKQALKILREKTMALAAKIGRECTEVKLRRTKTKWGHCARDGSIQYNWQIVMAPEPVVDYLVAHEVSHLVHHNHGKRFWRHVEKLCPDYVEHEKWLKSHGHKVTL